MQIPAERLDRDTLRAIAEEYVSREGTDYGERETPFDLKVAEVLAQIDRGEAIVVFDPAGGTVSLLSRER